MPTLNWSARFERSLAFRDLVVVFVAILICLANSAGGEERNSEHRDVDFERHVAPLLGRLGCNSAACHGAFGGGKGGLQMSLFGYSPKMDFRNLDQRIDESDPETSLFLQKPTGQDEHEGGVRFETDSQAYRTIKLWIEQGAKWKEGSGKVDKLIVEPRQIVFRTFFDASKVDPQSLKIIAAFSDGTRETVTELCQFTSRDEGIATVDSDGHVTPTGNGDTSVIVSYGNAFAAVSVLTPYPKSTIDGTATIEPTSTIDRRVADKLSKLNLIPSPRSHDEEFLRRVMIDTIGTIPTAAEVVSFCRDKKPNKREKKIDELLSHPMHAALWATRMCDITKCDVGKMGKDQVLGARRAQMWHDWFRVRLAENISYAEMVRGVITATSREGQSVGDWMEQEEALIRTSRETFENEYASRQSLDMYWRRVAANNETQLKENAELAAVAFTGVRLNCAQCHKHPFDRWTQDDYAAFANIFSRVIFGSSTDVNVAILEELDRRREAKKNGKASEPLPRIREVFLSEELGRGIAGSEPSVDVSPRAFGSDVFPEDKDFRQQFFDWLVASDNPYFAKSFVNRVWAVYFGIGIVDPVDDFSITNPPSHPELLKDLAVSFRESKFDIRKLEKQILMSDVYQRSSTPNETNKLDRRNFARQYVRPMLAEVALDAVNKALGIKEDFGDLARPDSLAIEIGTNKLTGDAGRMLKMFGRGQRESICDCDRIEEPDLRQFIFMINDESIMQKIQQGSIRELLSKENEELVAQLYLRVLGRNASDQELAIGFQHIANADERETAFDDFVWALLNTREFITNH